MSEFKTTLLAWLVLATFSFSKSFVPSYQTLHPIAGSRSRSRGDGILFSTDQNEAGSHTKTHQLSSAELNENGKIITLSFSDGSKYNFHSLWLRDACRDENHVSAAAGERILTSTPVVGAIEKTVTYDALRASNAEIMKDGKELVLSWENSNGGTSTKEGVFKVDFLKRYALGGVAQCLEKGNDDSKSEGSANVEVEEPWNYQDDIPAWLEPYTGFPEARATLPDERISWNEFQVEEDGCVKFKRYQHKDLMEDDSSVLLGMIRTLLSEGVVLIDGMPDESNKEDAAGSLLEFVSHTLGGMQKDPTRSEPNWKIVHKPGSSSISYNPVKRLNQHTDSSIPPHGIPALVLGMHYVKGYGANTLTDGFEIANILKKENPEGYELLCKYGYDGERDFAASRVDSTQEIAKGLVINRRHPIFLNDQNGNLTRLQYNEVFRMPSTLPFDIFLKWYEAFSRFCELAHSAQYQQTVPMKEGTLLLMNNWRVLHGRAGGRASPDRHVVGGTILRESVYSRAMQLSRHLKDQK